MNTAVTWADVAFIGGWALLGLGALIVTAVVVVILLAIAGVFNDWSH